MHSCLGLFLHAPPFAFAVASPHPMLGGARLKRKEGDPFC